MVLVRWDTLKGSSHLQKVGNKFVIFIARGSKFYTQKPQDFPVTVFRDNYLIGRTDISKME